MTAIQDGSGADHDSAQQLLDTPLGVELQELTRRIIGPGPASREAVVAALQAGPASRLEAIRNAAIECRRRDGETVAVPPLRATALAAAVASELSRANAVLPQRQREALALRELLRLSYAQIGAVMGLEEPAVASLLARARMMLRDELRAPSGSAAPCIEREHALRVLARRQDSEPLSEADDGWIFDHLAECPGCERAHAAMLEASLRYRAWGGPGRP